MPAVQRAVLHALEFAHEDLLRWCTDLSDDKLISQPDGLPSIAFHLRHIGRSLDRLLSYAEGRELSGEQLALLRSESEIGATRSELFVELASAFEESAKRIRGSVRSDLEEARTVGKQRLPTTFGGLLVHVADHTQRHVGQVVTTAKLLTNRRSNYSGDSFLSG